MHVFRLFCCHSCCFTLVLCVDRSRQLRLTGSSCKRNNFQLPDMATRSSYLANEFNREVLASLTLEPRKESRRPRRTTSREPFAPEVAATMAAAAALTAARPPPTAPLAPPPSADDRTALVIACMKRALASSIASISMPAKQRPLDPASDFTFKVKSAMLVPRVVGERSQGQGRYGAGCCSSPRIREAAAAGESDDEGDTGERFEFSDYAPMCYRHIREYFSVDAETYQDVLCGSGWHSIPTPGKSTAQLFFCGQNWVIKTMTRQESKFLRAILHRYYYHVRDNPHTLLPHFVGHHSIRIPGVPTKLTFVIMCNVFATPNKIHEKFDLKGSTVGRFATKLERKKVTCTKKDLDINRPILVGSKRREILMQQVTVDCDFLRKCCVMDYSFLLGIHVLPSGASLLSGTEYDDGRCFTQDQGGMGSLDLGTVGESGALGTREIYYVGIIDILQEYNLWKTSETVVQSLIHDGNQISSVSPKFYAARFVSFVSSLVM